MAQIAGFTTFENTCVDSTFAKSNNNKFNVVHKDDVKILIDYYSNKLVDMDKLEVLRFPARKFLNREDLSNKDKLKYLNKIMKRFDETGANTIPVHDMDSIHLYNKDGNPDVGYNIQTAVDSESKMFVALIVSQKATDHHQFPNIMNKSIENMGVFPHFACADAGYNTRRTLEYIEEIIRRIFFCAVKAYKSWRKLTRFFVEKVGRGVSRIFRIISNTKKLKATVVLT